MLNDWKVSCCNPAPKEGDSMTHAACAESAATAAPENRAVESVRMRIACMGQSLSVVSPEVARRRVSMLMARAVTTPQWACQRSSGSSVQVVSNTRTRPSSLPQ